MVIVCSSTGDGDPPNNAAEFVRFIGQSTLPNNFLCNVSFALLGLGDSNYSTFQGTPRKIEKCMVHLGAKRLFASGVADDQAGLERTVESWINELFIKLYEWFGINRKSNSDDLDSIKSLIIGDNNLFNKYEKCIKRMDVTQNYDILKIENITWPLDQPCLIKGDEKVSSDVNLRVPIPAIPYLSSFIIDEIFDESSIPWQNGCNLVGAASRIHSAKVIDRLELTNVGALKSKHEIQIQFGNDDNLSDIQYEPGDAFYFIIRNRDAEVNYILHRLNLLSVANRKCQIVVDTSTKKSNAVLPKYIPEISSYRYIFTYCLDIRRAPSRPLLRVLANYATDEKERRRLLELCSAQGVNEFTSFVRQANLSLIDILAVFTSCRPPICRLIELLPRLVPRPYSAACTQSHQDKRIRFVYSIMTFPKGTGRCYKRCGLATDYLMSLNVGDYVEIMLKEPTNFRFPPRSLNLIDALHIPLIMVGPGTGVVPFIAFLQYIREKCKKLNRHEKVYRELYFGCQNKEIDFIFRNEMLSYVDDEILSDLFVCESRPTDNTNGRFSPSYVQSVLKSNGQRIANLLTKNEGENKLPRIYICGDAKGMSKDVWITFVEIVMTHCKKSEYEAKLFLDGLKAKGCYIEDVWT